MRRYTKPHLVAVSAPVVSRPVGNQTIGERARRILADNNPLSAEEWFILTQIHLICLFRRAGTEWRKTKISKYLSQREEKFISQKKDPKTGLTPQDFIGLNQWVVNQNLAHKLETLIKRVKERKRQAKRETRMAKKIKDHRPSLNLNGNTRHFLLSLDKFGTILSKVEELNKIINFDTIY